MRHVLIAAAALAACGFLVSTSANAQESYQAGGPNQIGSMCKVATDTGYEEMDRFGYHESCGYQAAARAPKSRARR